MPAGTCEELVRPILEESSGHRVGDGFTLASAPEFFRANSALEDFLSPWMTVVASKSRRTVERVEALFRPFGGELRTFNDPAIAEMIKCTHNVFNATKISFWNEVWMICERLGLPADEVASVGARARPKDRPTSNTASGAAHPTEGPAYPRTSQAIWASGTGSTSICT